MQVMKIWSGLNIGFMCFLVGLEAISNEELVMNKQVNIDETEDALKCLETLTHIVSLIIAPLSADKSTSVSYMICKRN